MRDRDQVQWEARLFDRDLRTELNEAVAIVRAFHEEMKPLKELKAELQDDQEQVMDKLGDWYDDAAPGFFQKSKKIPKNSFLGSLGLAQTLDRRDNLKARRDSIGEQIVDVKDELDDIYETKLRPAKEARDGVMQQHFRERAVEFQAEIDACDVRFADLRALIASAQVRSYGGWILHRC
ncbi:hypothetical protein OEW28_02295 [Defluviimonas sp. WL0002]|uniref:Uncharacterized protein n=1 Tax=Albidovulum marisflavi TaxID=2984159 RepID=A0ABT2Z8P3_9RHOB|nr:hypothetical protein [Defluviimonas sp. WL0002]MCV2867453.1 hypothetical protein [Defluviimonas sp. WL0002]